LLYCHHCDKKVDYIVKNVDSMDYAVKDEVVQVLDAKLCFCSTCDTELFHEMHDAENQTQAFYAYRVIKSLIQPEKIIEIRKRYELTQRAFSKLLGFGEITITRYENGSLPTLAQNQILLSAGDPKKMLAMLNLNANLISEKEAEKLKLILMNEILSDENSSEYLIKQLISKYTALNQAEMVDDLNTLKSKLEGKLD
jgi:putative zinc finger/helix-turn-helix YgiT family protein